MTVELRGKMEKMGYDNYIKQLQEIWVSNAPLPTDSKAKNSPLLFIPC